MRVCELIGEWPEVEMSKKRDEMLDKEEFHLNGKILSKIKIVDERICEAFLEGAKQGYLKGWDAAIQNDERVLALLESLDQIRRLEWTGYDHEVAEKALTQFKESVK